MSVPNVCSPSHFPLQPPRYFVSELMYLPASFFHVYPINFVRKFKREQVFILLISVNFRQLNKLKYLWFKFAKWKNKFQIQLTICFYLI